MGRVSLIGLLALCCACFVASAFASSAVAANFKWTGASTTSHNWSDAANWASAPPSGEVGTLEFPELPLELCTPNPTAACYETTNDISGLSVDGISFKGPYEINYSCICSPLGEGIFVGAGGLTASAGLSANIPITLSAPQTWSLGAGAYFGGPVTSEGALNLPLGGGTNVTFNGGADMGPVTVTGSSTADTGENAGHNGTVWVGDPDPARSGVSELNGTDAEPVSVTDAAIGSNYGVVGPLTLRGADVTFGLLGASPKLTVNGGVTLDAASMMQMTISASPEASNSSEMDASGAVHLGGAHLSLSERFGFQECTAPAGQTYTLVNAAGSLEGTFGGLPDGSVVPLQHCEGGVQALRINYTAHAVTATVVGPIFTWVGGEDATQEDAGDWSHAANWLEDASPSTSSTLEIAEFSQLTEACSPGVFSRACYRSNNDLSGLRIEALRLDDGDDFEITGEAITLGSGGISASPVAGKYELPGEIGPGLHMPIVLGAPQTWHIEGQEGAGVAGSGVLLDGPLSGSSDPLTVDTNNGAGLLLANNTEVGPVTIQGEDAGDTGYGSRFNGGAVGNPLSSLNSSDGEPVTIKDDSLNTVGAAGPLTSVGGEVAIWALSAEEVRAGCYEEIPSSPGECAAPIQAGTLNLASATFDSESNLTLAVTSTKATPGTDYSDLTSTGAVDLGGALLTVDLAPMGAPSPACNLTLPAGQKYTLVSTTGALSGTFNNAPESGDEIPLDQLEGDHAAGCSPSTQKLLIEYNRLGTPQTVTGTVLEPAVASPFVSPPSPMPGENSGAGGATTSTVQPPLAPAPILGQRQVASPVSGTVSIRLKGTGKFVALSGMGTLPNGSEVEATHGRVLITVAASTSGKTESAEVYGGRFLIQQSRGSTGEAHLVLSQPLTGCPRVALPRDSAAAVVRAAKHQSGAKSRHIWVSEGGGSWGTNGRYVSTTVEGTRWLTLDECDRSEVAVAAGKVRVHDLLNNRTKTLTAGKSYVASRSPEHPHG